MLMLLYIWDSLYTGILLAGGAFAFFGVRLGISSSEEVTRKKVPAFNVAVKKATSFLVMASALRIPRMHQSPIQILLYPTLSLYKPTYLPKPKLPMISDHTSWSVLIRLSGFH